MSYTALNSEEPVEIVKSTSCVNPIDFPNLPDLERFPTIRNSSNGVTQETFPELEEFPELDNVVPVTIHCTPAMCTIL